MLHTQVPAAVQVSALIPHALHAPPLAPHAVADGVVQVWPEQQPFGQVVPLQFAQDPALQMRPMQSEHAAPPVPHWLPALPGSQVVPLQHPAHDCGSQTHWPPEQR
jgi:hypothetical protein